MHCQHMRAQSNASNACASKRRQHTAVIRCQSGASPSVKPIVVVGSVNADLVVKVDRLPDAGETIAGSSLDFFPGGKGANQAAAAARLGQPTYFIGQVGTDSNAAALTSALEQHGVLLDHFREVEGPSGTALVILQGSGENSIIVVGGANQTGWELSPEALQVVSGAGAVLLQREIPEPINVIVAEAAAKAGVPVMLDAGGVVGPISVKLLQHLTWCSPNETELARLTDMPTSTQEEVQAAAQALMDQGVDQVLVKLGADGSMLLQRGPDAVPLREKALPVKQVVDTTGAGDCFTAAFVVGVLQGREGTDALRFASAAAGLCVQRQGAMPSMPGSAEVAEVLGSS